MSSNKVNSRQKRAKTAKKAAAKAPARSARAKKVAAKAAKKSTKKTSISKGKIQPAGIASNAQSMDFYDVWLASLAKPDWVLDELIHAGDQVVLSGAPKSYKSFWASQFALSLALKEGKFLKWAIPKRRRVLFISLEMDPALVGSRLAKQVDGRVALNKVNEPALRDLELYHLFSINGMRSIDVLDSDDFDALKAEIDAVDPDVVIFDSLVRFHKEDENSNIGMSSVMGTMRQLCLVKAPKLPKYEMPEVAKASLMPKPRLPAGAYRTSLIIHHSRKESQYGARDYSAASMRGASAIHSEVDLVIATFPVSGGRQVSMNFSARKIREPEFEILELNDEDLHLFITKKKPKASVDIVHERAKYVAIALKQLGRSNFHRWEDIKNKAFSAGCPVPKKGIPGGETLSKQFSKLLDSSIVEREPTTGGGFRIRLTEDATKMTDEAIEAQILATRDNQNQNPSNK